MASKIYIYSTLTADQDYGTEAGVIRINGGANVANKSLMTPKGVATAVTEEQLEALRKHKVAAAHMANGFLAVSTKELPVSKVENFTKDMAGADNSSQATPETLKTKAGRAPVAKDK